MLKSASKQIQGILSMMIIHLKTIPDIAAGRVLYGKPTEMIGLSPKDVARVMQLHHDQQHPQQTGILAPHLHQIICLSLLDIDPNKGTLQTYHWNTEQGLDELELLDQLENTTQNMAYLSAWQAEAFLPILNYRALLQQRALNLPLWHNIADQVAGGYADSLTSAQELARLLDLPHCQIWTDDRVWQAYLHDNRSAIDQACLSELKMFAGLKLYSDYQQGKITIAPYQQLIIQLK